MQFHYESLSPRIRTSLLLSLLYVTSAFIFWIRGSRAGRKEAEHPAVVLVFTLTTLIPPICVLVMHARRKITAENYQLVMTLKIVAVCVGGILVTCILMATVDNVFPKEGQVAPETVRA